MDDAFWNLGLSGIAVLMALAFIASAPSARSSTPTFSRVSTHTPTHRECTGHDTHRKSDSALIAEPGLSGLAIDVDTSDNVVTLNGRVSSDDLRAQAERVARGVEGVEDVRNNLELKHPG